MLLKYNNLGYYLNPLKQITLRYLQLLLIVIAPLSEVQGLAENLFSTQSEQTQPRLELFASTKPKNVTPGQAFNLIIEGRVAVGQHIYSVKAQGEFAPEPTQLILANPLLFLIGQTNESTPQESFDGAFEQKLLIHTNDFLISQRIQTDATLHKGKQKFSGSLRYQICDNRLCSLPKDKPFSFWLEIK